MTEDVICPNCGRPVETHAMFDPPRCPVVRIRWPLDGDGPIESCAWRIRVPVVADERVPPGMAYVGYDKDGELVKLVNIDKAK